MAQEKVIVAANEVVAVEVIGWISTVVLGVTIAASEPTGTWVAVVLTFEEVLNEATERITTSNVLKLDKGTPKKRDYG